jgi:hypothetical protein
MRSTNVGTAEGTSAGGSVQYGRLLSPDELALPAICGQTGKPFVMVLLRQGRGVLKLIRAFVIELAPSVSGVPVRRAAPPSETQSRGPSRAALSGGANGGISEGRDLSFQPLNISAKIHIGSLYDGCPYCRAEGYFRCGGCRMFSCWNSHNEKPHLDHTDVWCGACRSWRCTSDEGHDDDSLGELTAYIAHEKTIDLRSRIAPGPICRDEISQSTSIRGYLK